MITSKSSRVTKQAVPYKVTFLTQKMKLGYEMTGSKKRKNLERWTSIWAP